MIIIIIITTVSLYRDLIYKMLMPTTQQVHPDLKSCGQNLKFFLGEQYGGQTTNDQYFTLIPPCGYFNNNWQGPHWHVTTQLQILRVNVEVPVVLALSLGWSTILPLATDEPLCTQPEPGSRAAVYDVSVY